MLASFSGNGSCFQEPVQIAVDSTAVARRVIRLETAIFPIFPNALAPMGHAVQRNHTITPITLVLSGLPITTSIFGDVSTTHLR